MVVTKIHGVSVFCGDGASTVHLPPLRAVVRYLMGQNVSLVCMCLPTHG